MCRIDLPAGGTHCPRCGLRVAALPRRARGGPEPAADRAPRRPILAAVPRIAALQGAGAGAAIVVLLVAVGLVTAAAGGPGRALVGDALLACAGALLLAAVLMPGVHVSRWAAPEVMRERAATGHLIGARRAAVLGAAAVCALGLVLAPIVPS